MDEPVYLWNWYRTRRHIQKPGGRHVGRDGHETLCPAYVTAFTRERTEERIRARWDGVKAEQRIAALDDIPLCKHCERASGGEEAQAT